MDKEEIPEEAEGCDMSMVISLTIVDRRDDSAYEWMSKLIVRGFQFTPYLRLLALIGLGRCDVNRRASGRVRRVKCVDVGRRRITGRCTL